MPDEFEGVELGQEPEGEEPEGAEPEGEEPEGDEPEGDEPEGEEPEGEEPEKPKKVVPEASYMAEKRKRQELERKLQEREEAEREAPKKAPQTWEEYYDNDATGTVNWINQEIARLVAEEDPANAIQIETLRDKKIELREYGRNKQGAKQQAYVEKLHSAVPDFTSKQKALTDFAVNELGYSAEDLYTLTSPVVVGERASIKLISDINKRYEASKAATTVKKKTAPQQPPRTERAGEGVPPKQAANLQKMWDEGKKTGDFTDYYRARGIIS